MGASQSDHITDRNVGKTDLVGRIKAKIDAVDPKLARELGGVYLFNIIKGTSVYSWRISVHSLQGQISQSSSILSSCSTEGEPPEQIPPVRRCLQVHSRLDSSKKVCYEDAGPGAWGNYLRALDLNNVTVYEGEPEQDPDTTFTLNEHYFKLLVQGREDPRNIMQAGKCSVTGDIMRAMKLEPYIKLG